MTIQVWSGNVARKRETDGVDTILYPHQVDGVHTSLHCYVSVRSVDDSTSSAIVTWSRTVTSECVTSVKVEFR